MSSAFLKMPKFLFCSPYQSLSLTARVIFCMLLERQALSVKNNMLDDSGRAFVLYSVRRISEFLSVSESTVKKCLSELESAGLIVRTRLGRGLPNRIIVLKGVTEFSRPAPQYNKKSAACSGFPATYDIAELERRLNEL